MSRCCPIRNKIWMCRQNLVQLARIRFNENPSSILMLLHAIASTDALVKLGRSIVVTYLLKRIEAENVANCEIFPSVAI